MPRKRCLPKRSNNRWAVSALRAISNTFRARGARAAARPGVVAARASRGGRPLPPNACWAENNASLPVIAAVEQTGICGYRWSCRDFATLSHPCSMVGGWGGGGPHAEHSH